MALLREVWSLGFSPSTEFRRSRPWKNVSPKACLKQKPASTFPLFLQLETSSSLKLSLVRSPKIKAAVKEVSGALFLLFLTASPFVELSTIVTWFLFLCLDCWFGKFFSLVKVVGGTVGVIMLAEGAFFFAKRFSPNGSSISFPGTETKYKGYKNDIKKEEERDTKKNNITKGARPFPLPLRPLILFLKSFFDVFFLNSAYGTWATPLLYKPHVKKLLKFMSWSRSFSSLGKFDISLARWGASPSRSI